MFLARLCPGLAEQELRNFYNVIRADTSNWNRHILVHIQIEIDTFEIIFYNFRAQWNQETGKKLLEKFCFEIGNLWNQYHYDVSYKTKYVYTFFMNNSKFWIHPKKVVDENRPKKLLNGCLYLCLNFVKFSYWKLKIENSPHWSLFMKKV